MVLLSPFIIGGRGLHRSLSRGWVRESHYTFLTQKERDLETALDYFLARYYSSTQGRFTSPDPILITPDRQAVPQLLNLYSYVGNNPLAYHDPTGMKRIKLGRSEPEILGDIDFVSNQLAQDNLSKDEWNDLMQQRRDLVAELEANQTVNAMLAELDAKRERNGLQASDFTLMTNPTSDLKELYSGKNKLSPAQERRMLATANTGEVFALVARGISREIFILANSSTYRAIQQGYGYFPAPVGQVKRPDFIITGATNARHEQAHRDRGASERAAYTLQLRVLNQFGPGAFANKEYYKLLKSYLENAARTEK